ncbi:ester cyclase [Paenibacillus sp. 1P07SE]|uniref:ester cyclase n=1 Tax=Paenibacillus sp. 1P07SE TaxID=3132209 RepID=UPI0039A6D624
MKKEAYCELYEAWVKAWHGEEGRLEQITDPDCRVHQARTDGKASDELSGAEALNGIITDGRRYFDEVQMEVVVGPLVDAPYVSARWKFTGTYNGEMSGAKAEAGKVMSFGGTDLFLIEDGLFKAYWVSSDGLHLMEQLGVF